MLLILPGHLIAGQVLFAATIAGDTQLYVINIDGSGLRQLTFLDNLRGRCDWSPDGKTIATYYGLPWQREIIILGTDGKILAQISDGGNNLAPNFSPDGQWVAFTSYQDNYRDDNGCEIYVMRTDGSQVQRLTINNYCDWQPNWAP
jgi:TolB protein